MFLNIALHGPNVPTRAHIGDSNETHFTGSFKARLKRVSSDDLTLALNRLSRCTGVLVLAYMEFRICSKREAVECRKRFSAVSKRNITIDIA